MNKKTGIPLEPQANRNSLLWSNPGVDGLKTGYTEQAGYCLAVSTQKEDRRLIAVVLGTASEKQRATEAQKLLTYGFHFENKTIRSAGVPLENVQVWKGICRQCPRYAGQDLVVTVPQNAKSAITVAVDMEKELFAPVRKGQTVGTLYVHQDNKTIASRKLVAQQDVPRPDWPNKYGMTLPDLSMNSPVEDV